MKHLSLWLRGFWMVVVLTLSACGGGGSNGGASAGGGGQEQLLITGTAATGMAIAGGIVSAKCQVGTATATTDASGAYRLSIAGGILPCILSVTNPSDGLAFHSVALGGVGDSSASANITPLTEMLTARLILQDPAKAFAVFNGLSDAQMITSNKVQAAQAEVVAALGNTVNTQSVDFVTGTLTPATAANPVGGNLHDKVLDSLKSQLGSVQQMKVMNALASGVAIADVKQLVIKGSGLTLTRLSSIVDLANNTVRLEWADSFPAATPHTFRIETQNPNGSFNLVESLANAGGNNAPMSWQRAITVTTVYRVVVVMDGASTPLMTVQEKESLSVNIPSSPAQVPQIVVDKSEPVSGVANLTLNSTVAFLSVTWYSDLKLIGNGAAAVGHAIGWNTATLTDGPHLLLARVQVTPDSYTEVRRSVFVSNSNLALDVSVSGSTGSVNFDVTASSKLGIARVEAKFDGNSLGILTTPNACNSRFGCNGSNNVYRFTVNAGVVGSGAHTLVVSATDGVGTTQKTVAVPISNPPALNLTSPADGAFVSGTLQLTGTASSDKAGAVSVTASLGDVEILKTSTASFSTTYSLSGLNAGTYTLTVRAVDSTGGSVVEQRAITVTAPALAYSSLFSMGTGGSLLAAEGNHLLYRANSTTVRMRNVSNGQEVVLANTGTVSYITGWQTSNGYAFATGKGEDCVESFFTCTYMWKPDGTRTNLSIPTNANCSLSIQAGGGCYPYSEHPRAHGNYVLWQNGGGTAGGRYILYDTSTNTHIKIPMPAGVNYLGNNEFDFTVISGVVYFFYYAQTGGEGTSSTFDVFRWDSVSQYSTKISSAQKSIYPQTDGERVAWRQFATTNDGPMSLVSRAVTGGAATTVSSNMNQFTLRDGVLAWTEITLSTSTSRYGGTVTTISGLKASTANGTVATLSILPSAILYAVGGGSVIYGELGKTWRWNSATRSSTLLIDAAPSQVFVSSNAIYFVMGTTQTVYRVGL